MLFGLGPGEMLLCLGPFFLLSLIAFIMLVNSNRRARSKEEDNDE